VHPDGRLRLPDGGLTELIQRLFGWLAQALPVPTQGLAWRVRWRTDDCGARCNPWCAAAMEAATDPSGTPPASPGLSAGSSFASSVNGDVLFTRFFHVLLVTSKGARVLLQGVPPVRGAQIRRFLGWC